jgi:peptidoglycan/xylan/chitin deacetylase (PgdA/CDA1 family)
MSWRIFCYHGVLTEDAADFARQIDSWLARGWRPVSLTEGLHELGERGRIFTMSFDDGRDSVCEVARRLLDDRGIRAILYLATDYVARGRTYRDAQPWKACTWSQLGRWLEAGHEIGSHTHTHAALTDCSPDWPREELERSREVLQRELGQRPIHFAYPYGQHDQRTYDGLRALGDWASAVTTDRGWNEPGTDPLRLRRDIMEPTWSMWHGTLRLGLGRYPALGSLARRIRVRCLSRS